MAMTAVAPYIMVLDIPVSYTHLDVYKRQGLLITVMVTKLKVMDEVKLIKTA